MATRKLILLKEAVRYFDSQPTVRTIRRWCEQGVVNRRTGERVVLYSKYEGIRRFTSAEAIEVFNAKMNAES